MNRDDLTPENKLKWWGDGEWIKEENEYPFSYKGYDCKVLRIAHLEPAKQQHVFGGHLCGYVKAPLELKLHEKGYDVELDCHGGITYISVLDETPYMGKIGENWIGFDCAHSMDIIPSMEMLYKSNEELKKIQKEHEEICE